MKKRWGIFCTEQELNDTKQIIKNEGLFIVECRTLSVLEKVTYLGINPAIKDDMWVIMFVATDEEYEYVVQKNKLEKVF